MRQPSPEACSDSHIPYALPSIYDSRASVRQTARAINVAIKTPPITLVGSFNAANQFESKIILSL